MRRSQESKRLKTPMKGDKNGWNDCASVFHTSGAKCQAFRKRNDFWNDLQELPAKRPFQVERPAQGDPAFRVSLGTGSPPFRSTSSPIGELGNGSMTDFEDSEARCPHSARRAQCGRRKILQKIRNEIAEVIGRNCVTEIPQYEFEDLCRRWPNGEQRYEPAAATAHQRKSRR
jgi:hypothetical protein